MEYVSNMMIILIKQILIEKCIKGIKLFLSGFGIFIKIDDMMIYLVDFKSWFIKD